MSGDQRTRGRPERDDGATCIGAPRLVVGMTSLPTRVAQIRPALESLLKGDRPPDAIILSLPRVALRGQGPWDVPGFLTDRGWHGGRVRLNWTNIDFGPGTKLLGALPLLDPADIVVLADDDVRYDPAFLAGIEVAMLRASEHAAFSYYTYRCGGMRIGQGCDGFAIRVADIADVQRFFDQHVAGTDLVFHDDLWISYFLAIRGTAVRSVPLPRETRLIYDQMHETDALRYLTGALDRDRLNRTEMARLRRTVPIPFRHRAALALRSVKTG
jgi:hypothetical protein